jgi:hypothetical protein
MIRLHSCEVYAVMANRKMRIRTQLHNDLKTAKKMRLHWWGLLCVIVGSLPIYWVFDHFGRLNLALPTLVSFAVLGLAIAIKWNLRQQVWFWIALIVFVALHVLLILFVPWPTKWVPASVFAGMASVELYAMLAILCVVEKFMGKPTASQGALSATLGREEN